MVRHIFILSSVVGFSSVIALALDNHPLFLYTLIIFVPIFLVGLYDMLQKRHSVLRLYPVIGHLRYLLQYIRPQIQQYFIETNQNGMPFSREERELVYARANKKNDKLPFGTQRDVLATGFDSINHSITPKEVHESERRLTIGNSQCQQPYFASRLNISAMSYGSISSNAIRALNRGAKMGGFIHNTGEGGLSPYHLIEGGDLVWQLGTAYFGCRTKEGDFEPFIFQERASHPQVKMIELKLSQGAKPAHGGILPAAKITPEIAEIRGIEMGKDCLSPAGHTAFKTPIGLLEFIAKLRELSGGKPTGFKLCIGSRQEFMAICKAMLETEIYPDFITIDGAEGGTGAAPVEFTDFVGVPLNEGLVFVHNALVGLGLREHVKLIAAGKITTGFDMICKMALGADLCNSARGMMFALGCIQSRRCHTNLCPTGITTQKPERVVALDIDDKSIRVKNYHEATIKSFLELLGAIGLEKVSQLKPSHVYRRTNSTEMKHYDEIYTFLSPGQLLTKNVPSEYLNAWALANSESFT